MWGIAWVVACGEQPQNRRGNRIRLHGPRCQRRPAILIDLLAAARLCPQLAVARIFQILPFQSSASGARAPLTVRWPTAMQNVLTQETLLSLDPRPADSGRAGRNAWPFHAKNPPRPAVMHLVLLAQDKVSGRKQAPPHLL